MIAKNISSFFVHFFNAKAITPLQNKLEISLTHGFIERIPGNSLKQMVRIFSEPLNSL